MGGPRSALQWHCALSVGWGATMGGAAEVWLAQQAAYDLWQARVAAKASKALSGVKVLKLHLA